MCKWEKNSAEARKAGAKLQTVQLPLHPPYPFSSPANATKIEIYASATRDIAPEMAIQLDDLVQSIKSKVRFLKKSKKPYVKMDKSSSVKVEIRSRQARKLIDKTLKIADRPGKRSID